MGTCVPAGSFLCDDTPDRYQPYLCSSGSTCGRGVCVPAGSLLCGTSGIAYCGAGTVCCGDTASTKDQPPFQCLVPGPFAGQCPSTHQSTTSYTHAPYVYRANDANNALGQEAESSDSTGVIAGAAGAAVVVLLVVGGLVYYMKVVKKKAAPTANVQFTGIDVSSPSATTTTAAPAEVKTAT